MTRRGRTRASASTKKPAASPAQGDSQAPIRGLALLLVVLGAAAFANGLSSPFVLDDVGSVIENSSIRHLWPLTSSFSGPFQSALAGRPVVNFSLAISYALGGVEPWWYHAGNLAVHLAAGLMLFGLLRRSLRLPIFKSRFEPWATPLAFVCALLWLVHPLQTEVIGYVTQRTESMMGLFYFATLYAALRAHDAGAGRRRWEAAAVGACALGMACKESMVSAPIMVLVYAAVFLDDGLKAAVRRRPPFYASLAATWIVLLVLNLAGPRSNSAGLASGVGPWLYLQDQAVMLVRYLMLTVWPRDLVIYYGLPGPVPIGRVVPGALVAAALGLATIVGWRRRPALAFLGLWFAVTLAPTTSIVPIATEVGAERRMYLPLVAVVVVGVVGGWQLLARLGSRRPQVALAGAAAVYLALASLTLLRNAEYHSPITLWETALARYPNGGAHYGLAIAYRDAGQRDEAMAEFRAAAADFPEAEYALGVELDAAGKRDEALEHYREFVRRRPMDFKVPATYRLMGVALRRLGRLDEAASAYERSLEMQPANVDTLRDLAELRYEQERYAEAVSVFRRYLERAPDNADGHNNLGLALVGLGDEAAAANEFRAASTLQPGDVRFERNLGHALSSTGRFAEAVEAYRRALALAPDDALLYSSLGLALAAQGQADASRDAFQQALRLSPDNPQVGADIGEAMRLLGIS